jgi:hypothetical protein
MSARPCLVEEANCQVYTVRPELGHVVVVVLAPACEASVEAEAAPDGSPPSGVCRGHPIFALADSLTATVYAVIKLDWLQHGNNGTTLRLIEVVLPKFTKDPLISTLMARHRTENLIYYFSTL